MATCRPQNVTQALESFAKQSYQEKELLLVLNNALFDMDVIRAQVQALPNARILQMEGCPTLAACLNQGVEEASGEYIAKMDDDDDYGERYLSDMMLAAHFSNAEVLGKGTHFVYLEGSDTMALLKGAAEHEYVRLVAGPTLVIQRDVLKQIPFPDRIRDGTDLVFLEKVAQAGCRIYSTDRFNFLLFRCADPSMHTWQVEEARLLRDSWYLQKGMDLRRVMI